MCPISVGKCLRFGEGFVVFFFVTSVCDCPVALGGKAEFEFGDLRKPCRTFRNSEAFFGALK